ncbi:hypothetical protein ACI0FR_02711 [Paenochrobactrum sp. BZR 201-1]
MQLFHSLNIQHYFLQLVLMFYRTEAMVYKIRQSSCNSQLGYAAIFLKGNAA